MTPLTITVCLSNYCQNHCSYCVSRSHGTRWDPPVSWEVYKPAGFEHLNPRELAQKFGNRWYRNKCPDKSRYLQPKDVLEISWLEKWLNKYTPNAVLHLSGGEPLIIPTIVDTVDRLVKNHRIVLFTNGQNLASHPRLLSRDIYWHVTWHQAQIPWEDWYDLIKYLDPNRTTLNTVLADTDPLSVPIDFKQVKNYKTKFNVDRNAQRSMPCFVPDVDDLHCVASTIHLIDPNGLVYPCNTRRFGPIGDIYLDTYHPSKLDKINLETRECVRENRCSAYQSAVTLKGE